MLMCLLVCTSIAHASINIDGIYYNTNYSDKTASVARYSKYSGEIIIPETITIGTSIYTVTEIEDYAFRDCLNLKKVTIPGTVKRIGLAAFDYCTSLYSVTMSEGLTEISWNAFRGCKMLDLEIPNSVLFIGSGAFDNTQWLSTKPAGLVYAGKVVYTYKGDMPSNGKINIKDGTKAIAQNAFNNREQLKSATLPNSLTVIGGGAFSGCCNLVSINLPTTITYMGASALSGCSSLESIDIPDSITNLNSYTFSGCSSLKYIDIPENIKTIEHSAFSGCKKLETVTFKDNEAPITIFRSDINYKFDIFDNCPLKEIYLGRNLFFSGETEYSDSKSCFQGISTIENVIFGSDKTQIEESLFFECSSLSRVVITDNIKAYGERAFQRTAISSIDISANVESIGTACFDECKNLKVVNVRDIAKWCSLPPLGMDSPACKAGDIHCDGEPVTKIVLPENMPRVNNIEYLKSLKEIVIPKSAKNVAVIYSCPNLESVVLEDGLTSFGGIRFNNAIEKVIVPESVTDVWCFWGCKNLKEIKLPRSLTTISNNMFNGCSNLTRFIIGPSVKSIGNSSFYGSGLTSITIPDNVNTIGNNAFYDCKSLKYLQLGYGVTDIPSSFCEGCTSLEEIQLPIALKTVGNRAFNNCTSLSNIDLLARIPPTCGSNVFDGVNKMKCYLNVTNGLSALYLVAPVWSEFFNIRDTDFTSINDIYKDKSVSKTLRKTIDNGKIVIRSGNRLFDIQGKKL